MRLLKTSSDPLSLENFYDRNLPKYAILSHTWADNPEDEVLYADIISGTAESKPTFRKLRACLRQAAAEKYEYCWIDTCCIDKTSSEELSKAINSMFRWYQGASTCFAFLEDVSTEEFGEGKALKEALSKSRWFARGWTLQELLAPKDVHFFGSRWLSFQHWPSESSPDAYLGSKISLRSIISQITGIDESILDGSRKVESASIAQRMSWAANRKTSRLEDEAYCLMGLFKVNMPMLYGEGSRAFIRLQEEIIKQSDDESIFAWRTGADSGVIEYHGLLADSPQAFATCGRIIKCYSASRPWSMTNKGLDASLHIDGSFAVLSCVNMDRVGYLALQLVSLGDGAYMRKKCDTIYYILDRGVPQKRLFYQTRPSWQVEEEDRYAFYLDSILDTSDSHKAKNNYAVVDAIFRNDNRPFTGLADMRRWIPRDTPATADRQPLKNILHPKLSVWAVFRLRIAGSLSQLILTLGLETFVTEQDPILSFDVFETDAKDSLREFASYESSFEPHYQGKRPADWIAVGGYTIKAARLAYKLKRLPGGLCFSVELELSQNPPPKKAALSDRWMREILLTGSSTPRHDDRWNRPTDPYNDVW